MFYRAVVSGRIKSAIAASLGHANSSINKNDCSNSLLFRILPCQLQRSKTFASDMPETWGDETLKTRCFYLVLREIQEGKSFLQQARVKLQNTRIGEDLTFTRGRTMQIASYVIVTEVIDVTISIPTSMIFYRKSFGHQKI